MNVVMNEHGLLKLEGTLYLVSRYFILEIQSSLRLKSNVFFCTQRDRI